MKNTQTSIANNIKQLKKALAQFPSVSLVQAPTPLLELKNLGDNLGLKLYAKRDDRTDLSFGGNKVRQLEYYFGAALQEKADTILITGAVQSNFVRAAATIARQLKMDCHIQLEERVATKDRLYHENGNVLLDKLLGANLHNFAEGENEAAADAALHVLADKLRQQGKKPYIIHLSVTSSPIGALGYVQAAIELQDQLKSIEPIDEIFIASGSALTHTGLLFGLKTLGLQIPVRGICVRRDAKAQMPRVIQRCKDISKLLAIQPELSTDDFRLYDASLHPGYGKLNCDTVTAIKKAAQHEGLLLDPVYSGKTMAAIIKLSKSGELKNKQIIFWHTGGLPALFAYADKLLA